MKKTLYEILEVAPTADHVEIQAAFQRLMKQYEAQALGENAADTNIQINLIKEAYSTLADHGRRSGYDASLASRITPTRLEVEIHEPHRSPQKTLLLIIGSLIAIGMIIQIAFMLLSYRNANLANALAEAQENKVRLREYEMEMGEPKSASEIEARRVAREQRQTEHSLAEEERRLANEARQRERELEESRRYASRISDERMRADEGVRRQAEYEQKRLAQEEISKKQQEEYAAKRQIEDDKRRLRELEQQNRR